MVVVPKIAQLDGEARAMFFFAAALTERAPPWVDGAKRRCAYPGCRSLPAIADAPSVVLR
jgi:hypothetical protein